MSLCYKAVWDHFCGVMISYVGEWHEEVPGHEESSGQSSLDKSTRSISCSYKFILCDYNIFMLWTSYDEGHISGIKVV